MTTGSPAAEPVPTAIDTTVPSIARVYDANLGGKDNYEVDRAVRDQILAIAPEIIQATIGHRAFLTRVTRFLANQARVGQFLDCGSGLPTAENTHQVARRTNPDTRVVYVDNDPSVIAHGRALLEENELTRFIAADIFSPEQVLTDPTVTEHLDWSEPIALFQLGTFHHYDGKPTPAEIMTTYVDALPSGSYVALSHFFDPENTDSAFARRMEEILVANGMGIGLFRTRRAIEAMLPGLEMVDPGLVPCEEWWPDGPRLQPLEAMERCIAGVVARKP